MSSTSYGLPKKPVLICLSEVVEAEDPGHEELDESMPKPDAVPKGVAVPETPSDKDREAHELTHLSTQPWCSVCVRAKGVDERLLRRKAGERAEAQGVDHMPVIQFNYAYLSSVNEKGEPGRMRTILDTSTGYGTACVIDVKGGGDKYAFLKELGYTRFRCRTDPSLRSRQWWMRSSSVCQTILAEETCPESRASLGTLEGMRLDVEDRFGSTVGDTHQCVPCHSDFSADRMVRPRSKI